MSTILNHIQDLLIFYVDTNYIHYITKNKLEKLTGDDLKLFVENLYKEKKEDSIIFVKESLKQLLKDKYPGDSEIIKIIKSQDISDYDNIQNIYNGLVSKYS